MTIAHGKAGSLTHWARPGIKPETSWFLVRFVSTVPLRNSSLCLLVGAFSPLTFKVIIDMYVVIAILLTVLDLFLLLFFSSLLLLFSHLLVWWLSLVLCFSWFFYFVCVSIVDFWLAITLKFWHKNLHIYEIVLSCWCVNCKCISSVLHLYPPLLMISDFGGIIECGWFCIFTVYIPLLIWVGVFFLSSFFLSLSI